MSNDNGLIECRSVCSTGNLNSNFYLRSVAKPLIGGGTIVVPPAPGAITPITLTGALAGNVLQANKTYRIDISLTAGSSGGATPYTLLFEASPTASSVITARQFIISGGSLTAGQSFAGWFATGLLKASATTSVSANLAIVYGAGDLQITIQSIVLTQLD